MYFALLFLCKKLPFSVWHLPRALFMVAMRILGTSPWHSMCQKPVAAHIVPCALENKMKKTRSKGRIRNECAPLEFQMQSERAACCVLLLSAEREPGRWVCVRGAQNTWTAWALLVLGFSLHVCIRLNSHNMQCLLSSVSKDDKLKWPWWSMHASCVCVLVISLRWRKGERNMYFWETFQNEMKRNGALGVRVGTRKNMLDYARRQAWN